MCALRFPQNFESKVFAGSKLSAIGTPSIIINPRRACAARVTVVVLSFCLSVCLSVTTFSAATRNKTANKRYWWVQCHTGFILKIAVFVKMLRSRVMA